MSVTGFSVRTQYAYAHTNRPNIYNGLTTTISPAVSVPSGQHTLMGWVKSYGNTSQVIQGAPICIWNGSSCARGPYISTTGMAVLQNGADLSVGPTNVIVPFRWYHLCITDNGSGSVVGYVNGNFYTTWTSAESLTTFNTISLGCAPFGYGWPSQQCIADFTMQRIYLGVLRPSEVNREMRSLTPINKSKCIFWVDPRIYDNRAMTKTSFVASGKIANGLSWLISTGEGTDKPDNGYNNTGVGGPTIPQPNNKYSFAPTFLRFARNHGLIIE